jgi:hypothetical protein|tara:strand:+ start:742 stop:1056 length:315 start_codon:yes stop_codon:yes gene_type:complete
MASGVYAKVDVAAAATWETVVAPPTSGTKVTTLSVCNRGAQTVSVRIALANSTTVTDADVIEYDTNIPANGVLERTGIVLDSTNGIQIYSSSTSVTAVAYGIDG